MTCIRKSVFSFLFVGLLTVLSDTTIGAQDICHLVQLKVDKVKGRVVTNDEIPYPFSSAKVELLREKKGGLIGSAITDNNGFFEIENIGKGEYVLVVWATTEKGLTLFTYDVNLRVTTSKQNRISEKMIFIELGGDCFDSNAKVREENRAEQSGADVYKSLGTLRGEVYFINHAELGRTPANFIYVVFQRVGCKKCLVATKTDIDGKYALFLGEGDYKVIIYQPSPPVYNMFAPKQPSILKHLAGSKETVFNIDLKLQRQ